MFYSFFFIKNSPKVSINVDLPTPGGSDIPIRKEFPDFLYNFFINSSAFFLSLTLVDSISVIPFERATLSDNNIFLYITNLKGNY